MKKLEERYYGGIRLEEDLGLCAIYDELDSNEEVIILDHGRTVLVHEMRYVDSLGTREDTGKTHIGFDFNYITFYYKGKIYNITPSTYYPFIDDDIPGLYNYVVYDIVDNGWAKTQASYAEAYNGIESLDQPYEKVRNYGNPKKTIPFYKSKFDFEKILKEQGGFREKDIYSKPHVCYDIQDDADHQVVRCVRTEREDGVRKYFDIDLKQKKIVG